MTVSWMLAATVTFALVAFATDAGERALLAWRTTRIPLRALWVVALLLASLLSARWWWPSSAPTESPGAITLVSTSRAPAPSAAPLPSSSAAPVVSSGRWAWPALSAPMERVVRVLWGGLSVTAALLLLGSAWQLRRTRRTWEADTIAGVPVLVSPTFGPAIVGLLSPQIVVPQWVRELSVAEQQIVLAHEVEHRRAGDVWLLAAMVGAVVLMPWNVGAWMIRRRLHRAIELDCDARVIARGVDPQSYAQLLLGAWRRTRRGRGWAPGPALAEHASQLGRRVEHLMRPMPQGAIMQSLWSVGLAVLLMGATTYVPVPNLRTDVAADVRSEAGAKRPTQPARRGRVLVVAPFDSAHSAFAEAIGAAVAADTAGRPLTVIPRKDQKETLEASGFSPAVSLTETDVTAVSRLLRADYVIRVKLLNNGARVETTGGVPGADKAPIPWRELVTITGTPNPRPGVMQLVILKALKQDTLFTRLR